MNYESLAKYKIVYHIMHWYPSDIGIITLPGTLVEKTLDMLKTNPDCLIDDIVKIED